MTFVINVLLGINLITNTHVYLAKLRIAHIVQLIMTTINKLVYNVWSCFI